MNFFNISTMLKHIHVIMTLKVIRIKKTSTDWKNIGTQRLNILRIEKYPITAPKALRMERHSNTLMKVNIGQNNYQFNDVNNPFVFHETNKSVHLLTPVHT